MTVSICMITYNHENYLKQAIDSVLMQKTTFDFELVIANDNSPDKTHSIVEECIQTHPNGSKIKYLHNKVNMGMMPNFANALKNCSGKYVAMCEGDDYWTDEFKLQKQVDFLEQNAAFAICFHKVAVEKNGVIEEDTITLEVPEKTTIYDLAKGNYIHTCSAIYRNNLFEKFPDYFYKSPIGDYFLHMLNSRYGDIYCMNDKMAVYRVHDTSYWSSKQQEDRVKIWVNFIEGIKPNFSRKIRKILNKQIKYILPKKVSTTKKIKLMISRFFKGKNN
ncbi:MAG: glycosyltransferase [Flavobacterium sp.]